MSSVLKINVKIDETRRIIRNSIIFSTCILKKLRILRVSRNLLNKVGERSEFLGSLFRLKKTPDEKQGGKLEEFARWNRVVLEFLRFSALCIRLFDVSILFSFLSSILAQRAITCFNYVFHHAFFVDFVSRNFARLLNALIILCTIVATQICEPSFENYTVFHRWFSTLDGWHALKIKNLPAIWSL